MQPDSIFWFRRDLRLEDNCALFFALSENKQTLPIFIFDKVILEKLPSKKDKRVHFIHYHIVKLKKKVEQVGSSLKICYGEPLEVFQKMVELYPEIKKVYCNHDYERYGNERDTKVKEFLAGKMIGFESYKDIVVFEKKEILNNNGLPFAVFTPYSKAWKNKLQSSPIKTYPSENLLSHLFTCPAFETKAIESIGFKQMDVEHFYDFGGYGNLTNIIKNYHTTRDFLCLNHGTTRISVYLRFGIISVRSMVMKSKDMNEKYLNELIWREFYQMILWNFPHVETSCFKKAYDTIPWENNELFFERWCQGKTGIPIVDAGMMELNSSGFMHNRARMIVASFLTKNLLIDWRWGEQYFANQLHDYELASNNGGWQWAASSGCDAAPYFRIFNPYLQQQKFDPNYEYVKKWIPDYNSQSYLKPIVDPYISRKKAIEVFATNQNLYK